MTTEPRSAKDVFVELIGTIPPEQWDERLTEACPGDVELQRRVRALLRAHVEPGSFLEEPAMGNTTILQDPAIIEGPGTVIGPYKLLQQIGEGGMGVVFMAEQNDPIHRTVALKIIKPGMDTRQVIARFEAERQALAMMDHPNIARVLDAGTTDTGRPYFVMDLVKGIPITDYCDQQHLTVRARLELMTMVCQAIQHAHQKGIIHRDLKPTNVLIAEYDGKPAPKIIDFGVAKATAQRLTERTMFTEFGQVIGTVEYMSPEQARFNQLDVDTRSDIYSLGVLLYELLAGCTPFDRKRLREAAFDEVLRIIREEEPPKPSTRLSTSDKLPSIAANRHTEPQRLTHTVRGELDWIVMRALEKERQRRFQTVGALVDDLQHYLTDQPVTACPPSSVYRLKKFIRRNKSAVLAGSGIAAALIVGTTLAAIGFFRATEQAEIARNESRQAKKMNERSAQVQKFLSEMLTSVNPSLQRGAAVTVQQMLDRAGQRIDPSFPNQPDVRAILHDTIGQTYFGLQLHDSALRHRRLTVDIRRRHLPEERVELAHALLDLATSEAAIGDWDRSRLSTATKETGFRSDTNLASALANCREAAAIFASELPDSDWRLAYSHYLEVRLTGELSGETVAETSPAALLPFLLLLTEKQAAQFPADFARAIAEAKRLDRAGDKAGAIAAIRQHDLAARETEQKLIAAGDRQALQTFIHDRYAPFLDVPWARRFLPHAAYSYAIHPGKDEIQSAMRTEAWLRESIQTGHSLWGSEHPHIALALYELAILLRDDGRLDEAENSARESFEIRKNVLGSDKSETSNSRDLLIDILQKKNKTDEANKLRREIRDTSSTVNHPQPSSKLNPKP